MTLPTLFFSHGSPMNAIENNRHTKAWEEVGRKLPRAKAILVISAHYETNGTKVTSNEKQKTIHDFYGFPQKLFDVLYEPKGSFELAKRIQKLVPEIELDDSWGVDHGAWSVLLRTHPKADIPVVQLSIDKNKTPREHYELAKKLQILRGENVLIIGSGGIVHNLRMMNSNIRKIYPWAISFSDTINKAISENDHEKIIEFKKIQGAREAVPTSEHFIPLLYVLGLQKTGESAKFFCDEIEMGSIGMASFVVK
jgi:4,5-DOPA dioxygenase extradiol